MGTSYLPEIENRIKSAQSSINEEFKSGWLGNYFAVSMLPGEPGKMNKMKTFKSINPHGQLLSRDTIDRFLNQQKHMLQLLDAAEKVDLNKVKTSISISKFIKLKLGDTLRVVIYHNDRHIVQAERVVALLQPHS